MPFHLPKKTTEVKERPPLTPSQVLRLAIFEEWGFEPKDSISKEEFYEKRMEEIIKTQKDRVVARQFNI